VLAVFFIGFLVSALLVYHDDLEANIKMYIKLFHFHFFVAKMICLLLTDVTDN